MSSLDLENPKRQSPVGVAVIFFKNLRRAANFFLAVILVQFGGDFKMLGLGIIEWAIVLAVIFFVVSYLQYLKFYFYVKGDQFIIEKGVLRQDKTNIPFSRIQTVNTSQNVIQQLFGVVGVKIDTAGSALQEIEIPALERNYAEQLQSYLMQKKYEEQGENETSEGEDEDSTENGNRGRELMRLSFTDLMKVGLTENHLRSGFLLFAIVNGYLWQYQEYLLEPFEPYLEQTADSFLASWVLMLPFVIAAFIIISVLYSLIRITLRYFGLRFYLSSSGVTMLSGLLKRNEFRVPRQKIQYLRWSANPLRALVGFRALRIKQAGSQEVTDKKSLEVPGIRARNLVKVVQEFFPERKASAFSHFGAHRLLHWQLFTWLGVVPSLVASVLFYLQSFPWLFYTPVPFLLIIIYFWTYRYYRTVQLRVNQNVVEVKKGFVFPSHLCLSHIKVQNVNFRQSVFQRRRNLATLTFYTAAGSDSMPHIPETIARELYNYLLYRVEVSDESWM